jgi:nucleotide-binding universal stress UspA family protein
MIKDIALHLATGPNSDPAASYALSIAERWRAHITARAYAYYHIVADPLGSGIAAGVIEDYRSEQHGLAKAAVAKFEKAAKLTGCTFETSIVERMPADAGTDFSQLARLSDLAVVCQAKPDEAAMRDAIIEGVLFHSGHPVIVVPYIHQEGIKLDRVLCCWDGTVPSARAIGDAIPLLTKASKIQVVTVATSRIAPDDVKGADMSRHLARHGLDVTLKQLASQDTEVADVVLSYAADSDATLIVMGAYGHSRLRQFILGGTTRGMLDTMTVPVLMSH